MNPPMENIFYYVFRKKKESKKKKTINSRIGNKNKNTFRRALGKYEEEKGGKERKKKTYRNASD